jgi:hypothetical protein
LFFFLFADLSARNRTLQSDLASKSEEAASLADELDEARKRLLEGQIGNERLLAANTRLKVRTDCAPPHSKS